MNKNIENTIRLVPPDAIVLGDGAVSCIVPPALGRGFIKAVAQVSNHQLRRIDPCTESVRTLRVTIQSVKRAAMQACEKAGITLGQVSCLLFSSQNKAVRATFAQVCGISVKWMQELYLADHTHLFAGDIITGLRYLGGEGELNGSDHVLMANGTCTRRGIVLQMGGAG